MSFDGFFLHGIGSELSSLLLGGRVDKIHQPDEHSIIIVIRSGGSNHNLIFSSHPTFCRVHLTKEKKTNPPQPPLFCMVLRKHLTGGKIVSIAQPGLERILHFHFDAINELGDAENKVLVCEIMGKHSNIILKNDKGLILDSIKRISHSISRHREVLPGRTYVSPPSQDKMELLNFNSDQLSEKLMRANENDKLASFLVKNLQGISPLLASEILHRCDLSPSAIVNHCGLHEVQAMTKQLTKLQDIITTKAYEPCVVSSNSVPVAFSAVELTHLAKDNHVHHYATLNHTADSYFSTKELVNNLFQQQGNLLQKLQQDIHRLSEKLQAQHKEVELARSAIDDKIKGQLITANLYQIKPGQSSITVVNYFVEDTPELTIELDASISPNANAQIYFKRYNKSKKTIEYLTEHISAGEEELTYLETIYTAISQATSLADLLDIKQELVQEGYLQPPKTDKKNKAVDQKPTPHEYMSSEGFKILVGKNNRQNDWLTLKNSKDWDIWFHAKKIPGAHVLIKTENKAVGESTLMEGALLAAYYSKARNSNQVPVDYTLAKHVKKPNGAKPGMVIYSHEQTIYINTNHPWLQTLGLV